MWNQTRAGSYYLLVEKRKVQDHYFLPLWEYSKFPIVVSNNKRFDIRFEMNCDIRTFRSVRKVTVDLQTWETEQKSKTNQND